MSVFNRAETPPNRAEHPNRKVAPATHYVVSYDKPTWVQRDHPVYGYKVLSSTVDTRYFPDKKSAKKYGNSVADLGFDPYVEKHDKKSQDAGYTQGKPAKLIGAKFKNRKAAPATHYEVTHNEWSGVGPGATLTNKKTLYLPDKKSAKKYGNSVADLGYDPYVEKHDKKSQDAGYSKGKTDRLMEAGFQARKFIKGRY
jgi:hypothetical protein